jgi:hypothetical protein
MSQENVQTGVYNELQETQKQTLNIIKDLQNQEKTLFNELQSSTSSSNEEQIVTKINEISQLRNNLYKNIKSNYDQAQLSVAESHDLLKNEIAVINSIEKELKKSRLRLKKIENEKEDKIRMTEINTYYSQRYQAQTNFMKQIIVICIPILLVSVLMKKEIIPKNIAMGIIGIILVLGSIRILYTGIDLMRRDNMNYDEYEFYFDPNSVSVSSTSDESDQPGSGLSSKIKCVGSECCDVSNGLVYDSSNNVCKESFVSNVCAQRSFGKTSAEVTIFNNGGIVKPYDVTLQQEYYKF